MLLLAESEADFLRLAQFSPKPGLFERNQGHQQFHDERTPPVFTPVARMLFPPDADTGQIGLIGREMVMPPPITGGFTAAILLAFGITTIFLAGSRPWVGLIPLPTMDATPWP